VRPILEKSPVARLDRLDQRVASRHSHVRQDGFRSRAQSLTRHSPQNGDGFVSGSHQSACGITDMRTNSVHSVNRKHWKAKCQRYKFEISLLLHSQASTSHKGRNVNITAAFFHLKMSPEDVVVWTILKLTTGIMYTTIVDVKGTCN
jgi:hypothetical protein